MAIKQRKKNNTRGFTVFFAMLIATLTLSLGIVLYDLFIRSLTLSQVAKQSQFAIYAADTGAECALYWDFKFDSLSATDQDKSAFATSSQELASDIASAGSGLVCNTQNIVAGAAPKSTAWSVVYGSGAYLNQAATTTFWFSTGTTLSEPCSKVEVGKTGNPSRTTIVAHGFNTCLTTTGLRVERTLQVNY